jgi:hypothetical protein
LRFNLLIFVGVFERLYKTTENVKKLNEGKIFVSVMREDKMREFALDLNRFEQLFLNSVDKEGVELPKYSRFTEDVTINKSFTYKGKTRRKTRGDSMFLYDEGDFFKTFNLKVNEDGFSIYANTDKDGKDLRVYGDIIGLNYDSIKKLVNELIPKIIQETRRQILQ